MNIRFKSMLSVSLTSLLGFAVIYSADAAQGHGKGQMHRQIQTCVSEIGRHSQFQPGSRVVHWVVSFKQLNLAEARIGIDTIVRSEGNLSNRKFKTSCVTDAMGKLVEFRISQSVSYYDAFEISEGQVFLVA